VSAAQLGAISRRSVIHVRPGDVHDRRRRTEPHWVAQPELRICAFGATAVESREGPIGGRWLEGRPGQILKYLICERHRVVQTDEIAEAIWPDAGPGAGGSVRYFVHALRGNIEPARAKRAPATFVVSRKGGYTLNSATVHVDADDFEAGVRAGMAALERGAYDDAQRHLDAALALYQGDFLADEPYANWAIAERDRLRTLAAEALRALARIKARAGEREEALALLERVADLQPYDSDIQRKLIAMLIASGRRSDAVRRYDGLRRRFTQDFGEEPDFRLPDVSAAEARLE
jgi:DNA-binding SARP family transcriptional activator